MKNSLYKKIKSFFIGKPMRKLTVAEFNRRNSKEFSEFNRRNSKEFSEFNRRNSKEFYKFYIEISKADRNVRNLPKDFWLREKEQE